MRHPATAYPFAELHDSLTAAVSNGRVSVTYNHREALAIYTYSRKTVYEADWDDITLMSRGLILDLKNQCVLATPFPKFFNYGEGSWYKAAASGAVNWTQPNQPFEVFEKLDGSLIIIFFHGDVTNGKWKCATKGSFTSAQAQWAQKKLDQLDLNDWPLGTTFLAEAIYPENRIVVPYVLDELVMLAAYDMDDGQELSYDDLNLLTSPLARWYPGDARREWRFRLVTRHVYKSLNELVDRAKTLPSSEEGWVVRFADGTRLKIKGEEYKRLHRAISNVTPLAIWELMLNDDNVTGFRKDLPEEFWQDFDAIQTLLIIERDDLLRRIASAARDVAHLSDKELGLMINNLDSSINHQVRPFLFPFRKSGGDLMASKARRRLFDTFRPTANVLEGYTPGRALSEVLSETG